MPKLTDNETWGGSSSLEAVQRRKWQCFGTFSQRQLFAHVIVMYIDLYWMRILLWFCYPFFCQCAGIFPQIWNYYFNHVTVNVMSVWYENWITVPYFISDLLHAVTSHRPATTLKPPTAEGNNIHPLVTMQCSAGRNKKNRWSWHSCGCFLDKHPRKTPLHTEHIPSWQRYSSGAVWPRAPRRPTELEIPLIPIRSSICGTCWNKCDPRRPGQVRAVMGGVKETCRTLGRWS